MSPRPSARSTPTTSNGRRNHDNTDSESYLQQFRDELQRLEEAIAGFASERGEMKRVLEDYAVSPHIEELSSEKS